jgi:carboxyl-terminal processing protease
MHKKYLTIITLIISLVNCNACYAASKTQSENNTQAEQFDSHTLKLLDLFGDVFDKIKKDYVTPTSDKELIEHAINGMLTSLDPHSGYLDEKSFKEMREQTKGEFGGLGIEVTMDNGIIKVISPIDDTPAFKAGIKASDYIISINDEPIMGMSLSDAVKKMRGKAGTKVKLTVIREGKSEPMELTLTREIIKVNSVKSHQEDNIGYIRINSFISENTAEDTKAAINNLKKQMGNKFKGLILDLRNNPGGLLEQAIAVSDLFINEGEIVSTRGRTKDNIVRYNADKGDILPNIPMVVLVNGGSASASEIVAGALQDHKRAIILGTKSFGKGSVQTIIPIAQSSAIRLTTARYYTPAGRSIQAEGIVPDITVEQAKIEFAKTSESKRIYSEANLKGHLPKDKKELSNKSKAVLMNKLDEDLYKEDYQLARSVDLLKALTVFEIDHIN